MIKLFISFEKYIQNHPEKGGLIGFMGLGFSFVDFITPILQFTTATAACIVALTSAYFSVKKFITSLKSKEENTEQ